MLKISKDMWSHPGIGTEICTVVGVIVIIPLYTVVDVVATVGLLSDLSLQTNTQT